MSLIYLRQFSDSWDASETFLRRLWDISDASQIHLLNILLFFKDIGEVGGSGVWRMGRDSMRGRWGSERAVIGINLEMRHRGVSESNSLRIY